MSVLRSIRISLINHLVQMPRARCKFSAQVSVIVFVFSQAAADRRAHRRQRGVVLTPVLSKHERFLARATRCSSLAVVQAKDSPRCRLSALRSGPGSTTNTITLSCGKLTTGVTVPQWSSILMLRNLKSPETYFQAAFRVQSPWSIKNPNGDNPHEEAVVKPVCFVFDFAPTRALRQIADYGSGLSPETPNPEQAVEELVKFLPVLAYDGSNMTQVDAAAS